MNNHLMSSSSVDNIRKSNNGSMLNVLTPKNRSKLEMIK